MIDWTGAPPHGRVVSLRHTLELLHERRSACPLIVEVGTSESYNPDGLGNAMLAFGFYAKTYGAKVLSVDVQNVENSKALLEKYIPGLVPWWVEFFLADAFEWVTKLTMPVDLLYMDAGYEICEEPNYQAFCKRFPEIPSFYVELFKRFPESAFRTGSLMLFDDTIDEQDGHPLRGKGVQLIPYLLERGWRKATLKGVPVFPMVLLEKI